MKNGTFSTGIWDHPRIRGEHFLSHPFSVSSTGSSPHTRGARHLEVVVDPVKRIIPAYAGSTDVYDMVTARGRDHPRIRGEHSLLFLSSVVVGGSSPHTRGALVFAYPTSIQDGDHPRIRGEHTTVYERTTEQEGSSPHTRGAPASSWRSPPSSRIIPAYAGSTGRRRR